MEGLLLLLCQDVLSIIKIKTGDKSVAIHVWIQ